MRIDRFQMERTQCLYENEVEYNLSESGVQPLTARELVDNEAELSALLGLSLKYDESNGSPSSASGSQISIRAPAATMSWCRMGRRRRTLRHSGVCSTRMAALRS